ncbi:hypothetical protein SAMN04515647_1027 [Cohaesibacter sp. ES.047]|nr:hypothetical protein SAMN04515647_1027 [Cohaesibacter sp. ES.047]
MAMAMVMAKHFQCFPKPNREGVLNAKRAPNLCRDATVAWRNAEANNRFRQDGSPCANHPSGGH